MLTTTVQRPLLQRIRFSAALGLGLVLAACAQEPEQIELLRIPSPSGAKYVRIATEVYGAGLGTDYPIDTVRIGQAGGGQLSDFVFGIESNGSNALANAVSWSSDSELKIQIPGRQRVVRQRPSEMGVSIRYQDFGQR